LAAPVLSSSAPLLKVDEAIGVLVLYRQEVRPVTDTQVELLMNFATQAVIAIENVRLFEAEQERTRELTEALEQQTATSEVPRVISASPNDLQPVFETCSKTPAASAEPRLVARLSL